MKKTKRNFLGRGILVASILLLILFVLYFSNAKQYLDPMILRQTLQGLGALGPLVFIGLYAFSTAAFLPGSPFTIAGGYVFGPFWGTLYTVVGATIGAVLGFLIARYVAGAQVHEFVDKRLPAVKNMYDKLETKGFATVLVLRLLPIFPFTGLNYALGLTSVKLRSYFLATLLGIIPFTFVYSYFGDSLSGGTVAGVVGAIVLIVIATLIAKVIKKLRRSKGEDDFDVIVIGAGSGGLNVASFMNRIGTRVLLIDKNADSIGGDCLNFGCVPSKALIHAANIARSARLEAEKLGLSISGQVDLEKVMDNVKSAQNVFRPHENPEYFRKKGIQVELGEATFVGEKQVSVAGKVFSGERIVIATGSRPRELKIPGSEQVKIWTNETIFGNTNLPKKLLVIGGGPIGMEIASAYEGFGSEVTIVNRGESLLGREDVEIAGVLEGLCVERGMVFHHGAEPVRFLNDHQLVIKKKNGSEETIDFDMVLAAIGRELNVDRLNLEKANISKTERGLIEVDEYLRTTNKNVYVCGDAAGAHQFTHAAELHASTIIRNMLSPLKKPLNTDSMAWVTFTSPEVATFGLSEFELKERGISYEVLQDDFSEDDRAIVDQYPKSLVKMFVDQKGRLLGGTMIAPHAGEITQELMLAQSIKLPLSKLFSKVYPYPTATRINRRVAGTYLGRKLTTKNAKLLRILLDVFS